MRGIQKHFAGIPALADASLESARARCHALIGQNGAGKSTLIKVLTGYHRRDAARCFSRAEPLDVGSPHEAQADGISTIYQEINLVPLQIGDREHLPRARTARASASSTGAPCTRRPNGCSAASASASTSRTAARRFQTATQQMVAIARAIGFSARLVIMDEPTSSLDEREVEVLFDVIRQLKAEGVSVIFVSHKLDELYEVCDRVTHHARRADSAQSPRCSRIGRLDLVCGHARPRGCRCRGPRYCLRRAAPPATADVALLGPQPRRRPGRARCQFRHPSRRDRRHSPGLLGAGRTETARLVFGADRLRAGEMKSMAGRLTGPRGRPTPSPREWGCVPRIARSKASCRT